MRGKRHSRRKRRGFLGRIAYAFRERQIYLRSEGDVQFITLRPWTQLGLLCIALGGLFWTAYASVNVAFKDQLLILKERRMYEARLDYEDRVAELRRAMDGLNRKLLLDQAAYLEKVDGVRAEFGSLSAQHEKLVRFFRQGWFPMKDTEEASRPADPLKSGFLEERFGEKYAADFATGEEALMPLADLRGYYAALEDRQVQLLEDATAYVEGETAKGRRILADLGIGLPLEAAPAGATGGPFIAASLSSAPAKRVEAALSGVADAVGGLDRVKAEAAALPLAMPMAAIREISSGYGLRPDPFRRVAAMHAGVDFKGPWAEPVLAAAAGTVVRAGWDGGYGKLVEIMHDNAVSTRYGHLSLIGVSVGQRVERGGTLGRMGSTGRSTGPHLHYETRVNGEPIDPVRFWKARNDLQELETQQSQR
jgi:murein DD-endopeptidase MepM/ murein hydrolase activator NlpD